MSSNGINLAKAYVQIVPSAKGIKNNLGDLLNDDAGKAGDSAGKRIVSGIKKVIAAAGIGKALAATISEGAKVEQSIGGIETLFKGSADKVIANAQKAYKTAGMSANEYMETVTGFSASLLQGLSGDTNKAADIAHVALTDMSDNANKMGTDMESIQNAYQGFAKQNYTMLDNLKLGYGGTKTEMQRLLKDAQEISGVKYDISNLSDVYSAIHVIQNEMGIAGTTAKEAATTLSGSFASMKGAVHTFLGNVATGGELQESFNAIFQTTYTFLFGNLLPMVGTIVTGFGETIINTDWAYLATEMLTDLCSAIGGAAESTLKNDGSIVDAIIAAVNEKLPEVVSKGVDLVLNLATGMLNNLPKLINTAEELAGKFLQCIIDNGPKVLNSGIRLVSELAKGLINNLPKIVSAAVSLVLKLLTTILENAPKMLEGGLTLIGKVAAGIVKAVPDLIAKIPGIVKDIKEQFTKIKWGEIGKNIIEGVAKGITGGVGKIIDAAKEAAGDALKAAKKALGINSPSRVFRDDVGEQSIEGWIWGIKRKSNTLADTMKAISKQSIKSVDIDALKAADIFGEANDNLTVWDGNYDLKELFNYVMDVMERYGDKQAEALITAIANMKMFANNREIARFMSDLGFSRG